MVHKTSSPYLSIYSDMYMLLGPLRDVEINMTPCKKPEIRAGKVAWRQSHAIPYPIIKKIENISVILNRDLRYLDTP